MRTVLRLAGSILLVGAIAGCSGATEQASDPESRYHSLIAELRCLVCQNQSISDSNAPLAADLREQVRAQIAQGRSDEQIGAFLTDRYGDYVLYRPPFKLRTLVLWLGPFAALLLAALAAVIYIRRRDRQDAGGVERETPAPTAADGTATPPGPGAYLVAGAGLLIFGLVWYGLAGSWETQVLVRLSRSNPAAAEAAALDADLSKLRGRLRAEPDDAAGWAMVARGESRRGRHAAAAQAMAEANRLTGGQNPDWLVEEGEALAWVHDGELAGAPQARFAAALALAPDHPRALWYAGLAALRSGDTAAAAARWRHLLRQDLPQDVRDVLEQKIAELGGMGAQPDPTPPGPAGDGVTLRLQVSVAPELASQVPPGATLLVYALEPGGPRMPLAVHRQAAGSGPWLITLDDSKSMLPGRKLSGFGSWQVLARISASGDAQAQPGDLQGQLDIGPGEAGGQHRLVIDQRLP